MQQMLPWAFLICIIPICVWPWFPKGEILAHGLIFPWPGVSGLLGIVGYHLSTWLFSANYDFGSSIFYSYAVVLSFFLGDSHLAQVVFLCFGYLGCVSGMFLLARCLGFSTIAALLSGVLYLLLPAVISGMPVEILNLRVLPYYVSTPFLLAVTIKILDAKEYGRYLAILGLVSILLCAPGYSSLQYFTLHFMLLSAYFVFHSVFHRNIVGHKVENYKKAGLGFSIILAANFFWLLPFLVNLQGAYIGRAEIGVNDADLMRGLSVKLIDSFRMLAYPAQASVSPWIAYYYTSHMTAIVFLFWGISIFAFIRKRTRLLALFPGMLLVLIMFLAKGVLPPFSGSGSIIFLSMPYIARLFRNPEYFNTLVVFLFPLVVGLGFGEILEIAKLRSRTSFAVTSISISLLLVVYGWQFVVGGPLKHQITTGNVQTLKVPQYFADISVRLRAENLVYRNLEVPLFAEKASFVASDWGKTYLGVPPFVVWSGKFFVNPLVNGQVEEILDESNHPQKELISYATWLKVIQFSNVRHVVYFKDTAWDSLKKRDPDFAVSRKAVEMFLSDNPFTNKAEKIGRIELRTLDKKYFLPVLYTPKNIIWSPVPFETIQEQASSELIHPRVVLLSDDINAGSPERKGALEHKKGGGPILEFKRSSLTKYRVRIHGVNGNVPLVFSEGFHPGWKVYPSNINDMLREKPDLKTALNNYRILDGNARDQATRGELENYVLRGQVTDLGDFREKRIRHWEWLDGKEKLGYTEKIKVDFISKNFQDTIQNNNLPSGPFWETWLKKPLSEDIHLTANGYANAWLISPVLICAQNPSFCINNSDGTYDLELIVEFWSQRLLQFGLIVSGFLFLLCSAYLCWCFIQRKPKVIIPGN